MVKLAIVVQANTITNARNLAINTYQSHPAMRPAEMGHVSIEFDYPRRLHSAEGNEALHSVWNEQVLDYQDRIDEILAADIRKRPLGELLEDRSFRTACRALGNTDAFPVRVYDEDGNGISTPSAVRELPNMITEVEEEHLWVVGITILSRG